MSGHYNFSKLNRQPAAAATFYLPCMFNFKSESDFLLTSHLVLPPVRQATGGKGSLKTQFSKLGPKFEEL